MINTVQEVVALMQHGSLVEQPALLNLSLRDYFAGQAMIGVGADDREIDMELFADWCYAMADAMLEAREERKHDEQRD